MKYTPGFTEQDLDKLVALTLAAAKRPANQMPIYVGEFGQLGWDIGFMQPAPKNQITSWYLPKRARKILAEGRIGRKESGFRLVVYRSSWVSITGVVQFIGPDNQLVNHASKKFRYELYNGTTLLLQTNSLKDALNYTIQKP